MLFRSPVLKRHENAMNTLKEAKIIGIILDESLLKSLALSKKKSAATRIYMFNFWCKQNDY